MHKRGCLVLLVVCLLALEAACEDLLMPNETWESGYLPVKGEQNELFYYLVKSRDKNSSAPLIIWLNGGPGCSSAYGLFQEIGPYIVHPKKLVFYRNEYSWNNFADLLFVDQPVNVGFSIVRDDQSLCLNESCVASDFYAFLLRFYDTHPEYQHRPLYITGESYGGHYVPSIAARIARIANPIMNLRGIAVGDPFTSQGVQLGAYPYYLLENGNFSIWAHTLGKIVTLVCQVSHFLGLQPTLLTQLCDFELAGLVKLPNDYDIRMNESYDKIDEVLELKLNSTAAHKLLGVKKTNMSFCNDTIYNLFAADLAMSTSPEVEYLLSNNLDVMIYFGDKDYICNWRGGEDLANSFQWTGTQGFRDTHMKEWSFDGSPAGRYRKFEYLNFMVIYDAGHMMPMDQNKVAYAMIQQFIARSF